MSAYVLPVFFLLLLGFSFWKRVSVYDCFIEGVREACRLMVQVFPYIGAICIAIALFRESGLSDYVAAWLSVPMGWIGIPAEIAELLLLIPVSGNGAVAMLSKIFTEYGADSYIGRCAAVAMSSSETIFYISAVYLSDSTAKKLRGAVPIALFANLCGAVVGCLLCRL